jgi:hypothetical protein
MWNIYFVLIIFPVLHSVQVWAYRGNLFSLEVRDLSLTLPHVACFLCSLIEVKCSSQLKLFYSLCMILTDIDFSLADRLHRFTAVMGTAPKPLLQTLPKLYRNRQKLTETNS